VFLQLQATSPAESPNPTYGNPHTHSQPNPIQTTASRRPDPLDPNIKVFILADSKAKLEKAARAVARHLAPRSESHRYAPFAVAPGGKAVLTVEWLPAGRAVAPPSGWPRGEGGASASASETASPSPSPSPSPSAAPPSEDGDTQSRADASPYQASLNPYVIEISPRVTGGRKLPWAGLFGMGGAFPGAARAAASAAHVGVAPDSWPSLAQAAAGPAAAAAEAAAVAADAAGQRECDGGRGLHEMLGNLEGFQQ